MATWSLGVSSNPMGFKADGFAVGGRFCCWFFGMEPPEIFSKFRVFFGFGVVFFLFFGVFFVTEGSV